MPGGVPVDVAALWGPEAKPLRGALQVVQVENLSFDPDDVMLATFVIE